MLTIRTNSPIVVDQLIFSVPHCLLTMGVRRDLLGDIHLIEKLDDDEYHITIKSNHLGDSSFYISTPEGTIVDHTLPWRSSSFSSYLDERAKMPGYENRVSFYSIHRRADEQKMVLRQSLASRHGEPAYYEAIGQPMRQRASAKE